MISEISNSMEAGQCNHGQPRQREGGVAYLLRRRGPGQSASQNIGRIVTCKQIGPSLWASLGRCKLSPEHIFHHSLRTRKTLLHCRRVVLAEIPLFCQNSSNFPYQHCLCCLQFFNAAGCPIPQENAVGSIAIMKLGPYNAQHV